MKKALLLIGALVLGLSAPAQVVSTFSGQANAVNFNYGGTGSNGAALQVGGGGGAAGTSYSITLNYGFTSTGPSGIKFNPFGNSAALPTIAIGSGASYEVATLTSVSCSTPTIYQSCQLTASFTNAHGAGDVVRSGDAGLQEALNYESGKGGGVVLVDSGWQRAGGTNAMIAAAVVVPQTYVEDNRGQGQPYWTPQAASVTLLSAPAALVAANITQPASCPTGATCGWTAAEPYFTIAYVDILGNLTVVPTPYQVLANLTASVPVTIASPAAETGAVGWVAFAGASATALDLLPVTTAAGLPVGTTAAGAGAGCTLTTAETIVPACAIGSAATFNAVYVNTNMLAPLSTIGAGTNEPLFQAHATFAYQPSALPWHGFQTDFTAFPANATTQAEGVATIGTMNLPIGYLNTIGRTIRVSGKFTSTVTTASTESVALSLGGILGYSSNAPKALCTITSIATPTGTTATGTFSCTLTTNAVGTTAVGSVMPDGFGVLNVAALAGTVQADTATAAVTSVGLFSGSQIFVGLTNTATASSTATLLDLHIETLQ
jgi:hypothetical protein